MTALTIIEYEGTPVGVVADGHARLNETLVPQAALTTVKGMALFAMEVQDGNIDGPYTERRALAYAKEANRQRANAGAPGPVRPGRG
jgi:hypothetical protein